MGQLRGWEYQVLPEDRAAELDALGRDGWELVTAGGGDGARRLYLKRPGPDLRERITLEQREVIRTGDAGSLPVKPVQDLPMLSPELGHLLASTGHTDFFTICDRGFPVPLGPQRLDLALTTNIPTVLDVLAVVQHSWVIDRVIITHEMEQFSPARVEELRSLLGHVPMEQVSHIAFKRLTPQARATVRTGDATPYANLIVVGG